MKKTRKLSAEELQEFRKKIPHFELHQLRKKSAIFFWGLFLVLFGYQVLLGLDGLIVVGIMIVYKVFEFSSIKNAYKEIEKKEYEDLKAMAEIPKNRFGN